MDQKSTAANSIGTYLKHAVWYSNSHNHFLILKKEIKEFSTIHPLRTSVYLRVPSLTLVKGLEMSQPIGMVQKSLSNRYYANLLKLLFYCRNNKGKEKQHEGILWHTNAGFFIRGTAKHGDQQHELCHQVRASENPGPLFFSENHGAIKILLTPEYLFSQLLC